jgi:hypothetical protein
MEEVGIVYGHSVFFMANWYTFGSFGMLFDHLVYFSRFGMLHQEKSGNTDCFGPESRNVGCAQKSQVFLSASVPPFFNVRSK